MHITNDLQLITRDQQNNNLQREITALHGELSLKTEENTSHLQTISALEREGKQYADQVNQSSTLM